MVKMNMTIILLTTQYKKAFKSRSLRYHYNFNSIADEKMTSGTGDTFGELEKMKPFHPVTNKYACGIVMDGEDIITARPNIILPYPQTIDFVPTIVQRENKEQFGDFEYVGVKFEPGRESAWKMVDLGVYKMTLKEGLTEIEEVRIDYLDKTTKEVHTVIYQFTALNSNLGIAKYTRYGYIPNTMNGTFKAYRYIALNGTEKKT